MGKFCRTSIFCNKSVVCITPTDRNVIKKIIEKCMGERGCPTSNKWCRLFSVNISGMTVYIDCDIMNIKYENCTLALLLFKGVTWKAKYINAHSYDFSLAKDTSERYLHIHTLHIHIRVAFQRQSGDSTIKTSTFCMFCATYYEDRSSL